MLTKLDDEHATAQYGARSVQLGIADISRYWFGDFVVLWRPRVAGAQALSMGMQGEAVRWLRQSLAQLQGGIPGTGDSYDYDLVKQVEDFQRDHRLTIDGIAGRQT